MAARGQAEAVAAFLRPLQQTLSCLTPAVLLQGYAGPDRPHAMTFPERYVPIPGRHPLELSVLHEYALTADPAAPTGWRVHSVGYWYQVRQAAGPELIAFHWHPHVGRGRIRFPHLHLGLPTAPIDIGGRRHIPTGRVSIEAVVRFLIAELHARPRRADWEAVLAANEAAFAARRSW